MMFRCYTDLIRHDTFLDRFNYLSLRGTVGRSTFGFERYLNQSFYTSREWRQVRHEVIVRDRGCDLAFDGYEISSRLVIHHMNPMTADDLIHHNDDVLNPEFLITTTHDTHNAIHYGNADLLPKRTIERRPGDTRLW